MSCLKSLIYIPYHDADNYFEDGILTRESAVLYMLYMHGLTLVTSIKKPRTVLDKKRYMIHEDYYPAGTIEEKVKKIFDESESIQFSPFISVSQVLKRRKWWVDGYERTIDMIDPGKLLGNKTLVYSDNPFAYKILKSLKEKDCKIYFDAMDNFAIHPSLNRAEKRAALQGYCEILNFADFSSANSMQTCDYLEDKTGRRPMLIKNGVFVDSEASDISGLNAYKQIIEKKTHFEKCVGYIGKIGARLNSDLIDTITGCCKDVLFVFVGPCLKDQKSYKLNQVLHGKDNILMTGGIPSAYVHSILDQFDVLMIPHAVGKAENGGDPEKLYHY